MALGHLCATPVAIITAIVLAPTGVPAAEEVILNIDITDYLLIRSILCIVLAETDKKTLDRKFVELVFSAQATDLKKEFDFIQFDILDSCRRKYNPRLQDLREKVLKAVFPYFRPGYRAGCIRIPALNREVKISRRIILD